MQTIAEARYNDMVANGTAEQQTAYWDAIQKMSDPLSSEFRDARYALMKQTWDAADADQDGLLNSEEFRVFHESDKKIRTDKGYYVQPNEDADQLYALMNSI